MSIYYVDNLIDSLVHGRVTSLLTFSTLSKRSLKNKLHNPKHPLQGPWTSIWSSAFTKEGSQLSGVLWEWLVAPWSVLTVTPFHSHILLACVCPPAPVQRAMSSPGLSCLFFFLFTQWLAGWLLREIPRCYNSFIIVDHSCINIFCLQLLTCSNYIRSYFQFVQNIHFESERWYLIFSK